MLSPSLEDYLEELYRFSLSQDIVRITDISQRLHVSLPSVSKAMRKLKAGGYVAYQRYGEIDLTEQGRQMGHFLVERNRLLQEFLELICAECNIAAEAEAMEHYLSLSTIVSIQSVVEYFRRQPQIYGQMAEFIRSRPAALCSIEQLAKLSDQETDSKG